MKKCFSLFVFLGTIFFSSLPLLYGMSPLQADQERNEEKNKEYYDDDEEIQVWIGPGIYYGFWFDDEASYRNWHHHHHHGDHHRGHEHRGGHHGGGGHHRGGHR